MREFTFHTELWLPRGRDEVFPFFAEARNLEAITPPWLNFEVLTPAPVAMRAGALIEYRIRVHGIPIRWRTEIVEWNAPHRFVDVQLRGPYTLWHHTHTFEGRGGGSLCLDDVRYRPRGTRRNCNTANRSGTPFEKSQTRWFRACSSLGFASMRRAK